MPAPAEKKSDALVQGGRVQPGQLISRKEPDYPKLARQTGVKGTVELDAIVGADGKVKSARVVSGHPMLQRAAVDAVMQWVYRPTLLNGRPVESQTRIVLNFVGQR
jgi:protein TonB